MKPSPLLEGLPVWVNDANQVWPTLRIARSIPVSRLEWLWVSRGASLRDSSTAARAVFEVSSSKEPKIPDATKDAHAWFSNPYVYILITTLHELTVSKGSEWSRIRCFVEDCKDHSYEYLIVLAATDDELLDHKKVADKLRTELHAASKGRERLVIVPPAAIREEQRPITHLHHSPSHQDLLVRLRECVRQGAEARVQAYEEEVSRSYLNRSSSSWLFTKFFALKEGMAFVFVQLGRRDMAVRFYDELHSTMMERNERGNGVFCDQPAADVALGVTNPDARDCRTRLVENSITELDMRTYLFARQTSLMLTDRKFSEVAERGLKFITALARRCAEEAVDEGKSISRVFRDTWVFCTSRALAAALTPAIPSPTEADAALSVQLGSSKERHTARLIAGFHVHAMKAFVGLAHVALPGCLAPEDPSDTKEKASLAAEAKRTSNERLRTGLSNKKNAEILHSEIANAAASLYEMGGRARGAAALDGDAGVVRLRNGSYGEAETLLSAQCSRYSNDNGWDELHKRQRIQLARAEKQLDRVQEYLVSCLTMLYMSRENRKLWRRHPLLNDVEEVRKSREDAAYWAAEAVTISTRLPRVMKYKADRLFEISVLPNDASWLEGDPGTAVVRIISDIPTTITVDYVVVECRHTAATANAHTKPAIHYGDEGGIPNAESSSSTSLKSDTPIDLHISTPSSGPNSAEADPGVLILQSENSIDINSGINDVVVHRDEVPESGRYKVTLVALFMGNLKLVQVASKTSTTPIVTTKGIAGSRLSPISTSYSFADLPKGDVRFPMIFSTPRSPSASVRFEKQRKLYLAPQSVQFVHAKVISGQFGIKKGSKLLCTLLSSSRNQLVGPSRFVDFADTSGDFDSQSQSQPITLQVHPTSGQVDPSRTVGEAILQEELNAGDELETRIALQLHADCTKFLYHNMDAGTEDKECILQLRLACHEKDSTCTRKFLCHAERKISFTSPLEISARIELSSDWGDEDVSRAVGLDGAPLGDGGTLICAVRRRTRNDHAVTIQSAALETPAWLELRPDELPVHEELLPCTLGHGSLFTFAFDVLTRDEITQQLQYHVGNKKAQDTVFEQNSAELRLSRTIANSPRMEENQDDMPRWALERRHKLKKAGAMEDREASWEEPPPQDVSSSVPVQNQELMTSNSGAAASGEVSEATDHQSQTSALNENRKGEPYDSTHCKEAGEVVDLYAPQDDLNQLSGTLSIQPNPTSNGELATLKIGMAIEGLEGRVESVLERKICMNAFRRVQKRYRIERSIKEVGDAGKMMELQFAVRTTGNVGNDSPSMGLEYDEKGSAQILQYEVDADPAVWLVVGKRRGKLNVMDGQTAVGTAKLIPVTCGRQRAPCIRLFTVEGRGLALSRYENGNEYMQVTVMPCRTVTSACSSEQTSLLNEIGTNLSQSPVVGKSRMPEVIASDSFFGS